MEFNPFNPSGDTTLISSVTGTPSVVALPAVSRVGSVLICNLGTTYAVTAILYDTTTPASGRIGVPIPPNSQRVIYRSQGLNNLQISEGANASGTLGASGAIYVTPGNGGI